MKLFIYHGSDKIIDNPTYDGGRRFRDFGIGFYTTTNVEMAKSWATRKNYENSYVNKYIFDTNDMNALTYDLEPVDFIIKALNSSYKEAIENFRP